MNRLLLLLAALALLTQPVRAETTQPKPATITVTGSADIELKPDFARLYAAVTTTGDTVPRASDANRAATERVLERLRAMGVRREDTRTANLQVMQSPPRTDRDGREIKVPRFTATHSLIVTTRDLEGIGRLAGEILSVGDLTFESLVWGLEREGEGRDEARRAAVQDARRQAELYAEAAGLKLSRITSIHPMPSGIERERMMQYRGAAAAEPALAIVPPATLRVTASVQMVWELAP